MLFRFKCECMAHALIFRHDYFLVQYSCWMLFGIHRDLAARHALALKRLAVFKSVLLLPHPLAQIRQLFLRGLKFFLARNERFLKCRRHYEIIPSYLQRFSANVTTEIHTFKADLADSFICAVKR